MSVHSEVVEFSNVTEWEILDQDQVVRVVLNTVMPLISVKMSTSTLLD